MMSVLFSTKKVGKMHFDKWNLTGKYRVANGDACVGESTKVNNHEGGSIFARGMQPVNYLAF